MNRFAPTQLHEWYQRYHRRVTHDLVSSHVASLTLAELLDISEHREISEARLAFPSLRLDEEVEGAEATDLQTHLAALYSARSGSVAPENVLTISGPTAANYAALAAVLSPGDHVVCQDPVDEILSQAPRSLGADVSRWHADPARRWQMDVDELTSLIRANTKLIVIQNPCDPTGALIPKPTLEALAEIAQSRGIWILADETYRPLFHSITPSSDDFPPSTINLGYRRVVVTSGITKAYALAGIHAAWMACKDDDTLQACRRVRHYMGETCSTLDAAVAAEAVSERCIHAILGKNIKLCQANLAILERFVESHNWACSWVKPLAGTTAMLKFHKMGKPIDDEAFCDRLRDEIGLLAAPGSKVCGHGETTSHVGYVRVAYGGATSDFQAAIDRWTSFMEEQYHAVPTISRKAA